MDNDPSLRAQITRSIIEKANLKQKVFDNTFAAFNQLKETLHEFSAELNEELEEKIDRRVRIEYRDRGKYEAQIQVADDLLIFAMHTDIFEFPSTHPVWKSEYVKNDPRNSYCGMINIYNFLSDSFKHNRNADEGYLIGRLFVNQQMNYFVEGKRELRGGRGDFGNGPIDKESLLGLIENCVSFAIGFDLLVPPYDLVKVVAVEQLNTKFEYPRIQTGKLMGYEFEADLEG